MPRSTRLVPALLATTLLISLPLLAAETYYKWDKNGVTQYTKEKPLGVPAEEVRTMGGKSRPGTESAAKATAHGGSASSTAGNQTEGKPAVKKDPQICERARANLETLQSRAQVRMKDEYGEMQTMSDQQREEQIKKAQEAVKTHC